MVAALTNSKTYRIIAHRHPNRPIAARLPSVDDWTVLNDLEALTNPRIREEFAAAIKVRPRDLITGPEARMILAAFAYSGPSRFTDGSYGVYYAATELETAQAESRYHTERFLSYTQSQNTVVYKRVLTANIKGTFDDIRSLPMSDPIYDADPLHYAAGQTYGRNVYVLDALDGIFYNSVRHDAGTCIAAFRPRCISKCKTSDVLIYTYNGKQIDGMFKQYL